VPNRTLTPGERLNLFEPLFADVVAKLNAASAGDAALLWALRRKLAKDLMYLERGTPMQRRALKAVKRAEQQNLCANCGRELPAQGAELDRFEAMLGYTAANTRLLCHQCHVDLQREKGFA
jgi:ribosomal protein L44E